MFYSKLIMNGWQWDKTSNIKLEELRDGLYNDLKLHLDENQRLKSLKKRTKQEWRILKIRRIIAMSLSFIVLCIGWFLIYVATLYSIPLSTYGASIHWLMGYFLPFLLIAFVNYVVPKVLEKFTVLEKWDHVE